jgi:4-hydroxy-tetrahydrodipicolinate synthase
MQGIYHAFCLPELGEGGIDEKGLRNDIRHYIDVLGAGGLYVHGFYGNFWLLTSAERRQVMEIVADETRDKVPIVCRCAHQSLEESIALIKHAESAGADFISLLGPPFGGASESIIIDYFEAVSASTNLGISIFNTAQAGYVISPETMARLGRIRNVVALKNDVTMAHTVRVRQLVGDDIIVVDPSEENFLVSLTQFGQRLIYTGTGYMFDSAAGTPMRDYTQAALDGDYTTAAKKYLDLQPVRDLHHRWVLDPWSSTGLCPISTIKVWTQHLGLTGGKVRTPLPSMPDEQSAQLVRELDEAGLRSSAAA